MKKIIVAILFCILPMFASATTNLVGNYAVTQIEECGVKGQTTTCDTETVQLNFDGKNYSVIETGKSTNFMHPLVEIDPKEDADQEMAILELEPERLSWSYVYNAKSISKVIFLVKSRDIPDQYHIVISEPWYLRAYTLKKVQ